MTRSRSVVLESGITGKSGERCCTERGSGHPDDSSSKRSILNSRSCRANEIETGKPVDYMTDQSEHVDHDTAAANAENYLLRD